MGFPHLHSFILKDRAVFPITRVDKLDNIKTVNDVYIDCNGLIYKSSYDISRNDLLEKNGVLLLKMVSVIDSYIDIIQCLPNIQYTPITLHLVYDGETPVHKKKLQDQRDENIKKRPSVSGLTSINDRATRSRLIDEVSKELKSCFENKPAIARVVSSSSTDSGEADIKIVSQIINKYDKVSKEDGSYSVIITVDTDVFISFSSPHLIDNNILVLLALPIKGYHFFTSYHMREWMAEDDVNYKNLLLYLLFFCGSDYDIPIISGTVNQITVINNFAFTHRYEVSIKLLIECWAKLSRRIKNPLAVKGLTYQLLTDIVEYKLLAAQGTIDYYCSCKPLTSVHLISLLNSDWKVLIQNIKQEQIKFLLK